MKDEQNKTQTFTQWKKNYIATKYEYLSRLN